MAVAGTICFQNYLLKVLLAVVAGMKMATLFVIAHDAAHDNFTAFRWLNCVLGRLAFMPCLHNYSLWLIAHNQKHHQYTNVRGLNSWSPMSWEDYEKQPLWRQRLERLYRCPAGICFYYLVERWWKEKFYPYKNITGRKDNDGYLDFALLVMYLGIFFTAVFSLAAVIEPGFYALETAIFAFIVPFVIFNFMVGLTVYQQHTHETVPWFNDIAERNASVNQYEVIMHVRYPRWFNLISLNAMEHTAHHVDPRIPLYYLSRAQKIITGYFGDDMVTVGFSLRDFLMTMKRCKLYDYRDHCWLDFCGRITAHTKETLSENKPLQRAA